MEAKTRRRRGKELVGGSRSKENIWLFGTSLSTEEEGIRWLGEREKRVEEGERGSRESRTLTLIRACSPETPGRALVSIPRGVLGPGCSSSDHRPRCCRCNGGSIAAVREEKSRSGARSSNSGRAAHTCCVESSCLDHAPKELAVEWQTLP